jgi:hypothetical protein
MLKKIAIGWTVVQATSLEATCIPVLSVVYADSLASSGLLGVKLWTSPDSTAPPMLGTTRRIVGVTMDEAQLDGQVPVMQVGILRLTGTLGLVAGDQLWAQADGSIGTTRLTAPAPQVFIGTVISDTGSNYVLDVNVNVLPEIGELSRVQREAPIDKDVLVYRIDTGVWEPRPLDHGSDLAGLLDDDHPQYKKKHGFVRSSSGGHLVTMSYDKTTRKVTVTPTGATFDFYIDGVKFTKTGAQTAGTAHGTTTGKYYFYYDASGVLQTSAVNVPWSIVDRTVTPVALVYWENGITDGICFFEGHEAERNLALHYNLHFTQGTKYVSGGALSGYVLNSGSDADVTFAVATAKIADEDIVRDLTGVADGGPYTVLYRSGAGGDWTWDSTPTFPFKFGATYPSWNNINAGGAGVWGFTELDGTGQGTWCNYYLVGVPSVAALTQFVLVPGQATYSSLAAAQGETLSSLSLGTLPFEESAALYRLTFHGRSTHGGTHKAQLESVTSIVGTTNVTLAGGSPAIHNSLSGRSEPDVHPASSITFTPTGTISSTNVQDAIAEVASEAGVGGGSGNIDGGAPDSTYGGTSGMDGGTP